MKDFKKYFPIAEAIAKLLYPFAEVVLHDIKKNQIVKIFNNFSKRQVGDCSCIDSHKIKHFDKGPDIHGPFMQKNFYGHDIKYTTSVLRNDDGKAIGLMCINLKIDGLKHIQNILNNFLEITEDSSNLDELFNDDWENRINIFVQRFRKERNCALSKLTRQERMELVYSLHEAGAFRVTNAVNYIAKILGVSRATIYNYLNTMKINKPKK